MTYVVTSPCNGCKYTDCVVVCPCEAFHEGPSMLYINPMSCIDCDACRHECPVDAIYPDNEVPERDRSFIELNEKMAQSMPIITERKISGDD